MWKEVQMWFQNPPQMDIDEFVVPDCVAFAEARVLMKVIVDATASKIALKASTVMEAATKPKKGSSTAPN
eukprot:4589623-Prymnesium_polylepis.1